MKAATLISSTLVAALLWTLALIVSPNPFEAGSAFLIGLGMISMATVATVGMIVVGGRWAHRLGLGVVGGTIVVAVFRPVDAIWIIALVGSTACLSFLLSSPVNRSIRKLPAGAGPPPRAVLPALILISAPLILGLSGNGSETWALLIAALTAPSFALFYSRVFPGGLLGIRLVWPLLAIGLAPAIGLPAGGVSAGLGITVGAMAWHSSVKHSYHPPREVGSTFPIPPEMTPGEILEAAEIDDTGRPR